MKKTIVPLLLATALAGLTGCADRKNYVGPNNQVNQTNIRSTSPNGRVIVNNTDQNLRISTRARNSVESLKEVDRAHVIMQNNNAYVAVRLKNNGNLAGPGPAGTPSGYNYNGTTTVTDRGTTLPGTTGTDRRAAGYGTPGTTAGYAGTGVNPGAGYGAPGTAFTGTPGTTATDGTNYRPVITGLDKKIEDRVRAAERNVNKVYVSYDNNFYKRMTIYSNDLRNGRNRDGILNDFTNTVRGIFR